MEQLRLKGIDFLITLFMLSGIFLLAIGISGTLIFEGYVYIFGRLGHLVFGIIFVATGIGLRKFKNWARVLCLIQMVIIMCVGANIMIIDFIDFVYKHLFKVNFLIAPFLFILIPSLLINYLTRPKVKEQFK